MARKIHLGICANPECKRRGMQVRLAAKGLCVTCYIKTRAKPRPITYRPGVCDRCRINQKHISRFTLTNEVLCGNCKKCRRHELFLKGVMKDWGPGYAYCVLCKCKDLMHMASGYCSSCASYRNISRYCDKCGQRVGRNFCKTVACGGSPILIDRIFHSCLCKDCASLLDFRWAFGYERCVSCGSNDSRHFSAGICKACFRAEYKYGLRVCEWCGNRKTRRSFLNMFVSCSLKCKEEFYKAIESRFEKKKNVAAVVQEMGLSRGFVRKITRQAGIYTAEFVKERFGSIAVVKGAFSLSGEIQYFTEDKQSIRELMAEEIAKVLRSPLQLVCLPHVNMADIAEFTEWCEIKPEESLAVEKERKWFNMLSSWVNAAHILSDGNIIKGLRLYNGHLSRALAEVPGVYNCANLDFDGIWASETEKSLQNLFAYQRLAEDAVVYITVSNAERFKYRSATKFDLERGQDIVIPEAITDLALQNGYHSEFLWHMPYKQGTRSPMLTLGFRIRKIAESKVNMTA